MQTLDKLTTAEYGKNFIFLEEVDSTNTYLKQNGDNLPNGTAVITKRQTAGKGRQGKVWNDEDYNSSLKMSFLIKNINIEELTIIPLICGLASVNAINYLTGQTCMIKWPNDIVMNNKKIAGILCESRISSDCIFAVCGIGVNISQPIHYFTQQSLPYATSVFAESNKMISAHDTASYILNNFEELYNKYRQCGFEMLRENYKNSCITVGRDVKVIFENNILQGKAIDIDNKGELVCSIGGKLTNIIANEASVRGLYGYV